MARIVLLCGLIVLAACREPARRPAPRPSDALDVEDLLVSRRAAWDPDERAAAIAAGREALERFDCMRCHRVDDVPAAPQAANCVGCHRVIEGLEVDEARRRSLVEAYGEDGLRRAAERIEHYVEVPDLSRIGDRIRIDFLASFVREPHDLRPSMDEAMVRMHLDPDEAAVIARYFAAVAERPYPPSPPRPIAGVSAARIARGEQLFRARGCTACHVFGNRATGRTVEELRAAGLPARLAPNLRFVRERMDRAIAVAWMLEPTRFLPGTRMPDLGLTREDAEAIADFLYGADPRLEPIPEAPSMRFPAVLARTVSYEEVRERVLDRACVACHANDHELDPGPGNVGGFGFGGERLAMRTYEALVSGLGPKGERHGVLGDADGPALLLERMMQRRLEASRDHVLPFHDHAVPPYGDPEPGMPMGLPPSDDETIAILRTWIAQGCVGPASVRGAPGTVDGYRVADGPIAPNHGCEVRAPAETRPAWAFAPDAGSPR